MKNLKSYISKMGKIPSCIKKRKGRTALLSVLMAGLVVCALLFTVPRTDAAQLVGASEECYLYLAESAMVSGDYDKASLYLNKLYYEIGETSRGTLCNARLALLKADYVGAGVLYGKLEATGNNAVMTQTDSDIYGKITAGKLTDIFTATTTLDYIKGLEESGEDITAYGFTQEQKAAMEQVATGAVNPETDMVKAISAELDNLRNGNKGLAALEEAVSSTAAVDSEYKNYLASGSFDTFYMDKAKESLENLYAVYPEAFTVSSLDEAFVRTMVMYLDKDKLVKYAEKSDSQLAYCAIGQMLVDGHMGRRDLPSDFVTIEEDEIKAVEQQCEEAVERIKKKTSGSEVREAEKKLEAVQKTAQNSLLVELDKRIKPEEASIREQSALYLGKSTIDYAMGNTEKGDRNFKKSLETAPYHEDPEYADSMEGVNSALYDDGLDDDDNRNDSDIMDVEEFVEEAYNESVPHVSVQVAPPEDVEELGHGSSVFGDEEEEEEGPGGFFGSDEEEEEDESGFFGNEPEDDPTLEEDKLTALEELTANGTTFIAKENAALNIGQIDVSKFPVVSFNLQTSEPIEDLNNPGLMINDCNIAITEYKVEEKKYDTAIIYAVCDKSGSMEGSTGRLQSAVYTLAGSLSDKEKMGVIGFSDGVEFDSGIVSDASQLTEYIELLEADGGTNIASGTFQALGNLTKYTDSINVVIVMTDGEDDSFGGDNLQRLRDITSDGHTLVYTVGMGSSVNSGYLSRIARAGNGRFVYSFSASELKYIYDFIHAQMENNYVVTFTAKNTKLNDRVLTVSSAKESCAMSKEYTLGLPEEEEEEEDSEFSVLGFATKKIYKEDTDVEAAIKGTGFEKDMECFVTLKGDGFRESLKGTYVSDTTFSVTIPAKVPPGKYRAMIAIGDGAYEDEIEVLDGEEKVFIYGAYRFYGNKVVRDYEKQTVTISGDVTMNGFMRFNGDVIINGDTEKESVTMTSESGSSVYFNKPLPGLLKYLGNSVPVGSWHGYTIYKDEAHMNNLDEYQVTTENIFNPVAMLCFIVTDPTYKLYPHKLEYSAGSAAFNIPCMTQLMEADDKIPFKFSAEFGGTLDSNGHHTKGEVSVEDLGVTFDCGMFDFGLKRFNLAWDTYSNDYKLALILKWDMFGAENTGFEIEWKGGKFDALKIYYDKPWIVVVEPVPVTIGNFFVGFSGLSDAPQDASFGTKLKHLNWEGGCDVAVAKMTDLFQKSKFVKKVFGELSLVTFAETKVQFNIASGWICLTSNISLFGEFDCGSADVTIGNYKYDSAVLGLKDKDVTGLYMFVGTGPNISLPRIKLRGQPRVTLSINNINAYLNLGGELELEVDIIKKLNYTGSMDVEWGVYYENGSPDAYFCYRPSGKASAGNSSIEGVGGFRVGIRGWWPYIQLNKGEK